jgi:PRTRC genetic system protein F
MSDEDARELLAERFGDDCCEIECYLPSTVLPVLAPDDAVPAFARRDKKLRIQCLRATQLEALLARQRGLPRHICRALLDLQAVLARTRRSRALNHAQWAEPAYSAATLCMWREQWVGQILDDHFDALNCSGDATMYQALIPLADTPRAIRRQFKQLADMMDVIAALDRVLTLISE